MGWLRKNGAECACALVCALFFQAFFLGLMPAPALAGGPDAPGEDLVICTANGAVAVKHNEQGPVRHGPDCQCCALACRAGCSSPSLAKAPEPASLPLPAAFAAPAVWPEAEQAGPPSRAPYRVQPRAPPLASA